MSPREAVAVPFLEVSKVRLDGTLSSMIYWEPMVEGLGLDDLHGPFHLRPFCVSLSFFTIY